MYYTDRTKVANFRSIMFNTVINAYNQKIWYKCIMLLVNRIYTTGLTELQQEMKHGFSRTK